MRFGGREEVSAMAEMDAMFGTATAIGFSAFRPSKVDLWLLSCSSDRYLPLQLLSSRGIASWVEPKQELYLDLVESVHLVETGSDAVDGVGGQSHDAAAKQDFHPRLELGRSRGRRQGHLRRKERFMSLFKPAARKQRNSDLFMRNQSESRIPAFVDSQGSYSIAWAPVFSLRAQESALVRTKPSSQSEPVLISH